MKDLVRALQARKDSGPERTDGTRKQALRRALDAMLGSQSIELAMRAIVREARALTGAREAMLVIRESPLAPADVYTMKRGRSEAEVERRSLDTFTQSIVDRAGDETDVTSGNAGDPLVRVMLESHEAQAMASIRIASAEHNGALLLFADEFAREVPGMLEAIAYGAGAALNQAHLFMQIAQRNDEIASKNGALDSRKRVIGEIVHALANDLRTPLFAAHLSMQQALDGAFGPLPVQYRHALETALASNAEQRRLVDTLLLVARLESGDVAAQREEIDISREALRVAEELRSPAQAKGVHVEVQGDAHAIVLADPAEIRPAIMSLFFHAVQATPAGGSVVLLVRNDGRNVEFVLEDDGVFQQPASNARGAGLNLHIIKLIAENAGGSVSFEPRAPRGRRFTLRLPAA
jgi:signal transduction histidine kinase